MERVVDLRKKKKAPVLITNNKLSIAAQNQSNYQAKRKKMTHNQTSNKNSNVLKRVQLAGGDFTSVSENVAFADVISYVIVVDNRKKKKINATTYEGIASIIFLGWKNSKSHYKTMINKDFNHTGLKFKLDIKRKRLYATQVFGQL